MTVNIFPNPPLSCHVEPRFLFAGEYPYSMWGYVISYNTKKDLKKPFRQQICAQPLNVADAVRSKMLKPPIARLPAI